MGVPTSAGLAQQSAGSQHDDGPTPLPIVEVDALEGTHDFWADKKVPVKQEMIFASTGTKKPEDPMHPYGTGGNIVDGKEKRLKAEFSDVSHKRGIVSMARAADPNSASSQFFIVVKDSTFLDNQYSAFGEVVSGMDVADKIASAPRGANDRPSQPIRIKKILLTQAKSTS